MNILTINGSPKKNGACSTIIKALVDKLNTSNNKITQYDLNSLNIHGCQECFYCRNKKTDICAYKDDISEILDMAKKTDLMIISTPVFYADISAQLKCFIDRTWSYYGITGTSANHLQRNRTLVFILSYGYDNSKIYDQLYEKYKIYFNMFGFDNCYLIKAYGAQYYNSGITNKTEVFNMIDSISDRICN
jgi:multimeric flavodoxin WrbA